MANFDSWGGSLSLKRLDWTFYLALSISLFNSTATLVYLVSFVFFLSEVRQVSSFFDEAISLLRPWTAGVKVPQYY